MSITNLPDETLLEIFSHLGLLCATRNLSRVCKLWKQLCEDPHLYSELNFSSGELGHQLSDTLFKKAIVMCPRVKAINMSRTHITNAGLDIIVRSCLELQMLDLSFCMRLKSAKFDSLTTLPNLQYVNLLGTWKVTDPSLSALTPFFEKNIHLSLTVEVIGTSQNFSTYDEGAFFNKLMKLRHVDLHLGHELARNFLENPFLPQFASSVVELEIGSRFTSASISHLPPQIGLLTSLTSLSIVSHTLQELPSELANITGLRSLLISSSRGYSTFSTLPDQITQLVNLESLNLCWNRMVELPPSIVHMTSLRRLNLSNNMLEQVPDELGKMTKLKRLNLSENRLKTLPNSFGGMVSLERFNVSHNSLTYIPKEVFQHMRNLCSVDVQYNKLSSLPSTIAQLHLQELIANNNLLEFIPVNIGTNMPNLKKLLLNDNRLVDFPAHLEGLAGLKCLALSGNLLERVPSAIGALCNLRVLQLSNNRLQELPATVMFMRRLRRVELQGNRFASLVALRGIQGVDSLKSVHFDEYLQEDHSEMCMCKFCAFARFDEAHFEEIVEGDSDFEEELITLFFNCMESDLSYMTKAFKDNAFEDIYFISHKIKGALSNMGAVKLSHVCSLLESQARLTNLSVCMQLYEKLKLEYAHIKHVLVKRLQRCGKPYPAFSFSMPLQV